MLKLQQRCLNHYQTLGIGFRSTSAEVKSAYHILAKKFHPDQNSGSAEAEQKFRKVKEAYEALSDRARRAAYDQEYISSGKLSFGNAPSDTGEAADESLTRNQFVMLYFGVFGLPFLVSWFRSPSQLVQSLPAAATIEPLVIPAISPRDEIVRAFFNPYTSRWQRLGEFEEPPSPLSLLEHTAKHHKGLYQQAVRRKAVSGEPFQVYSVPLRVT